MLRKKLLARLGLLLVGFVAGAVVSILLLQDVLRSLDEMNADAAGLIGGVQELESEITAIESQRDGRAPGEPAPPPGGVEPAERLKSVSDRVGAHPLMRPGGEGAGAFARFQSLIPAFLASAPPGEEGVADAAPAGALHLATMDLGRISREHVAADQRSLSRRLRGLVIGLTVAALAMVNITSIVLLSTANMILRPVRELVECSRELALERFDRRVRIEQNDEFGELAHAYNHLAAELECNEQRKVQAMRHLAVTLNHELLNVISSIDLQLRLVDRRSGGDQQLTNRLREVHENLARIAGTISSLRNVRRIVLTDYMPGEKMLDLGRSVGTDDAGSGVSRGEGGVGRL
jgi:HAMP domain-containing protein